MLLEIHKSLITQIHKQSEIKWQELSLIFTHFGLSQGAKAFNDPPGNKVAVHEHLSYSSNDAKMIEKSIITWHISKQEPQTYFPIISLVPSAQ